MRLPTIPTLVLFAVALALGAYAEEADGAGGADSLAAPERGKGRLSAAEFFKRFPDAKLEFRPIRKSHDLGTFQPGQSVNLNYVVSAEGEEFGFNHKGAPDGKAVLVATKPDSKESVEFAPEPGCG